MKLYTIEEVAEMFKMSAGTLRNWIFAKKVKVVKVGRLVRITEEEVKNMIKNN